MITISYGDSPQIMEFALDILREAGFFAEIDVAQMGDDIYRREIENGIDPDAFSLIKRSKILLKSYCNKTPTPFLVEKFALDKTHTRSAKMDFLKKESSAICYYNDEYVVIEPEQDDAPSMILAVIEMLERQGKEEISNHLKNALQYASENAGKKDFEEVLFKKVSLY